MKSRQAVIFMLTAIGLLTFLQFHFIDRLPAVTGLYSNKDSINELAMQLHHSMNESLVNSTSEAVSRAIVGFVPSNSNETFMREFRMLYLSLIWIRTMQPQSWKTDIVIFTPQANVASLIDLGCSFNPRTSHEDSERCVIVLHTPLKHRGTNDTLSSYGYVDSILCLAEFPFASAYDWILRSDLDTFITPGFASWMPSQPLVVGRGGYASANANARLKWIATTKLGLNYSGMHNIGSTWYAKTKVAISLAQLTVSVMRYLNDHEFSEFEKCCAGVESWPSWHWPVILLYAGDIAVNQLTHLLQNTPGEQEMDYGSTSTEPLVDAIKHLHCWHTDDVFSKFKFHSGGYDKLDISEMVGLNSSRDYATVFALSSARLKVDDFKKLTSDPSAVKAKMWVKH